MTILVLALALLFAYPFLLYPLLLDLLASRVRRGRTTPAANPGVPATALVICALNEANVIRRKIENCLALDYPREKLRIVVVSDGSTDGTAAIVREYLSQGIELVENHERRGKAASLNAVVPGLAEEVVVFSDANVFYEPSALLHLTKRLHEPGVGCVSGRVILTNTAEPLRTSEKNYYSLEWRLQENAAALYSMAGADGAMYALKRFLFRPVPDDTLIEDFVIAMAVVRQGYRVVFEPRAEGWEQGPACWQEEYRRKVRIAAGAAQALARRHVWPSGAPARFWFVFWSHKLLRWLSPLVGIALVAVSLATWQQPLSQAVLLGAAGLAVAGLWRGAGCQHPFLDAAFYFLLNEVAVGQGLLKGVTGRQSVLWAKADR